MQTAPGSPFKVIEAKFLRAHMPPDVYSGPRPAALEFRNKGGC